MERNQGRRLTAEEELRVVEEGRQSGAAIKARYAGCSWEEEKKRVC